jgi:hypothetical protein
MAIDRVRVTGSVGAGGATTTNFYFLNATAGNLTALGNLYTALKAIWPIGQTYTIPNSGDTINEVDGSLAGGWSAAAPAPIVGTGGQAWSAPSGLLIRWKIAGVIDGHRPIAKTFLVPIVMGQYDPATGQVLPATQTTVTAAATAFISAATGFVLWHRPRKASPGPPPVTARPGAFQSIITGQCSPKAAVLRSRRD